LAHRRFARGQVLRAEQVAAQEVADQVDRLMALVGLDTIKGQDQSPIRFHLGAPRRIGAPVLRRAQQVAICLEQVQYLASRDRHLPGGQTLLHRLVRFIRRQALAGAQVPNEQEPIEAEAEPRQG